MTAVQIKIIERKLEFMRKALGEIEKIVSEGEAKYLKSDFRQAAFERYIERLVEMAVDAAAHILRHNFQTSAATYRDAFLELGRRGVIDAKLAESIAPSAGLRNFIAHEYDEIDPKKVFSGAKSALKVFPAYMDALRKLIRST